MPQGILIGVAVAATVASAGIALYSANEQAASQRSIAEYNRMAAEQNAMWQKLASERAAQAEQYNAQIAMFNAEAAARQGEFTAQISRYQNEQLRQQASFTDMQAQLQRNTAAMLRQQADGENLQAREQAERIRSEKARILGLQRSQYAKGGVTTEGSPLAILADTATLYDMQVADTLLLGSLTGERRRYEAGVADTNAGITALEANLKRDQARINDQAIGFNLSEDLFQANMNLGSARVAFDDAKFAEEMAGAGYRINMRQAQIEQMAGNATARATQLGGYADFASGIASAASMAGSAYRSGGGSGKNLRGEFQYYTGTVPKATAIS
jgi:hypothetical protein